MLAKNARRRRRAVIRVQLPLILIGNTVIHQDRNMQPPWGATLQERMHQVQRGQPIQTQLHTISGSNPSQTDLPELSGNSAVTAAHTPPTVRLGLISAGSNSFGLEFSVALEEVVPSCRSSSSCSRYLPYPLLSSGWARASSWDLVMKPMRKAISSGQAILSPWRFSRVAMKLEASSIESWVPVSSQADR